MGARGVVQEELKLCKDVISENESKKEKIDVDSQHAINIAQEAKQSAMSGKSVDEDLRKRVQNIGSKSTQGMQQWLAQRSTLGYCFHWWPWVFDNVTKQVVAEDW